MRFASLGGLALLLSTACGGANTSAEAKAPVAVTEVSLEAEAERPENAESEADDERSAAIEAAREAGVLGVLSSEQGEAFAALLGTSGLGESDLGGLEGATVGEAFGAGGPGLSGIGTGGGGTGQGTIGLGTIGTIGRGAGTGTGGSAGTGSGGFSGHGGANTPAPQVTLGVPTVQGELDAQIVRRIMRRHLAVIRYCYEKELLHAPKLAGELRVAFSISPDGAVVAASLASSTLRSAPVERCVLARLRTMMFPKPHQGVAVVSLGMDFAPPPPPSPPPAPPPASPPSSGAVP